MKQKNLRVVTLALVLILMGSLLTGCVTVRDMVYGYWQLQSYSDPDGSNATNAPQTLIYSIHRDNTVYLVTPSETSMGEAYMGKLDIDRGEFTVTGANGNVIYQGAYQLNGNGTMYLWLDHSETMLTLVSVAME